MSDRASSPPAIGSMFAGKYRLVQLLRSGGIAHVYLAERATMRPLPLDEAVAPVASIGSLSPSVRPGCALRIALKVLRPELAKDAGIVRRFERGVIAAGRVEHPNVARLGGLERLADGVPFCTMELLVGLDLADTLAHVERLPALRAARIAEALACALGAAHDAGVVHLDVKPENVFLVHRADGGEDVKLIDFGHASQFYETRHEGSSAWGTPEYMAPEQLRGAPVDPRMDVFALGVLLREMLTGEAPPSDSPLPAEVPARLARVIGRATSADPAARFASMSDVATSLLVAIEEMIAIESSASVTSQRPLRTE